MFSDLIKQINDLLQDDEVLLLSDKTPLGDNTLKDLKDLSDNFKDTTPTSYDYPSTRDMKDYIESERIVLDPSNVMTPVEQDKTEVSSKYSERWWEIVESAYFDGFYLNTETLNKMLNVLEKAHKSDNANAKALADRIEQTTITFPHMRKRRKQWGGQPTYRTAEIEPKKVKGYSMRSLMRKMPTIEPLRHKQIQERMKRSISHIQLWTRVEINPIESLKYNFDLNLYDAHVEFCERLFHLEQENTDIKAQAWDIYLPSGLLEDFIESHYEPTISGFAGLPSAMKSFIASAWDEYQYEARNQRQERYGMNLTKKDVLHRTSKADKSIFKHKFGG